MSESVAKFSAIGVASCPYLGLHLDRTVMLSEPTPAHRCFAKSKLTAPDLNYQKAYCLTANHLACPLYTPPTAASFATPTGPMDALSPRIESVAEQFSSTLLKLALRSWWMIGVTFLVGSLLLFYFVYTLSGLERTEMASSVSPTVALANNGTTLPFTATTTFTVTSSQATDPTFISASTTAVANPLNLLPTPTPKPVLNPVDISTALPPPAPVATLVVLSPKSEESGWWKENDVRRNNINDSFLYAGMIEGIHYVAAMRFDLSRIPRGAPILQGQLRLTGLRQDRFAPDAKATWLIELLPENSLESLTRADFLAMYSAPSAITLSPLLESADLAAGKVNLWNLDAQTIEWLTQQLLNGAQSVIIRIKSSTEDANTLFAWDSGIGPATAGYPPELILDVGAPPPTPPPLPTKDYYVATPTRRPENILTAIALNQVATAVAATTGTYTPEPTYVTPTLFPGNLETVQAAARSLGLPEVIPHTPTPANAETATFVADLATAVAQTTGTYTPAPLDFVTPQLILPSPPAESIVIELARATAAAIANLTATPTPMPYNAIVARYVVATPTPENVLTAAAVSIIATANAQATGTPQPTPWNQVVIIPTPLPVTPSPTPLPTFIDPSQFTPTPTLTAGPIPTALPDFVLGKILFRSNRYGYDATYVLDLSSYSIVEINAGQPWIYPMALTQLPASPNGAQVAIVEADANRILQIKIRSLDYGTVTQLTAFGPNPLNVQPVSYDPAWSPRGDLIAYVTNNTGNDEIFVTNLDGSVHTQLTFNTTEWDKHPTWSPDGAQIVFYSNRETALRRLWIMGMDGNNQRNLSALIQPAPGNANYEDWDPIWVH
jgi:hypothetical protein